MVLHKRLKDIPARIIDQNIQLAEAVERGLNHGLNLSPVGDIRPQGQRLGAGLFQEQNRFSGSLLFDVGGGHAGSEGPQFQGNPPSDPPAGSGDEGHFVLQVHLCLLLGIDK